MGVYPYIQKRQNMAVLNFFGKKFDLKWDEELFKMIGMGALLFYFLRFAKLVYNHYSAPAKEGGELREEHQKEKEIADAAAAAAATENTEAKPEEVVKSAEQKKEE